MAKPKKEFPVKSPIDALKEALARVGAPEPCDIESYSQWRNGCDVKFNLTGETKKWGDQGQLLRTHTFIFRPTDIFVGDSGLTEQVEAYVTKLRDAHEAEIAAKYAAELEAMEHELKEV